MEVCQDKAINFTCSADGNPAVHTYQLFENDTLMTDGSNSHGMWNRTMPTGGVFIYKCVANNIAGTGQSESVTVTVNGEHDKLNVVLTTYSKIRIWLTRVFCLYMPFWLAKRSYLYGISMKLKLGIVVID